MCASTAMLRGAPYPKRTECTEINHSSPGFNQGMNGPCHPHTMMPCPKAAEAEGLPVIHVAPELVYRGQQSSAAPLLPGSPLS